MESREIKIRNIARTTAAKALRYMSGAGFEEQFKQARYASLKGRFGLKDESEIKMLEGFLSKLLRGEKL